MADALVTAISGGRRHLLMVERGDGYGWAVPGGAVDPGETGLQAAVRELAEETGLVLPPTAGRVLAPRHVPDPRASDEAWAVTVPVVFPLRRRGPLPAVTGADDARRAGWIPARGYRGLVRALARGHAGGRVFAAHQAMLRDYLDDDDGE
jgi:ADP-ribose pyrophosphatase YjhB (NUDIX family)